MTKLGLYDAFCDLYKTTAVVIVPNNDIAPTMTGPQSPMRLLPFFYFKITGHVS